MNTRITTGQSHFASLRRRVRLLLLLQAAECAGLVPMRILRLHTFAYLSNVLAPVWDLRVLEGKVLKRRGGAFYPRLQRDLDRLVGLGLVTISALGHIRDDDGRWRLEGCYELNHAFADVALAHLMTFEEDRPILSFIQELAYALSALTDHDLDRAMSEDATYSDPQVSFGNVVDFHEWRQINYSANAARHFSNLIPSSTRTTPGEMLHLYIRHLRGRVRADRR
jgi:hypothetical protein